MRLIITLVFFSVTVGIAAQKQEALVRSLGHDNLSPAGQDTIYKYAQSHSKELWQGSWDLMHPKTMTATGALFQAFFADKLSSEDLVLINAHWKGKQKEYDEQVLANAPHFMAALNCQQVAFDSLLMVHLPALEAYMQDIEANLTENQKGLLFLNYEQSIEKLRDKRDDFLDHAQEFNSPVSTASEDYLAYAFDLMERIPTSYYYNLVRHSKGNLSFVEDLNLEAYFTAYGQLMDDVLFVLDDRDCRGTPAIPFYHAHLRENEDLLRRDALLFAGIHFLSKPDLDEDLPEKVPRTFFIDATVVSEFNLDIATQGDGEIDLLQEEATELGYMDMSFEEKPNQSIAKMDPTGLNAAAFVESFGEVAEKRKLIDQLSPENWRIIPGLTATVYFKEEEKNMSFPELTGIKFLVAREGNLIQGEIMGMDLEEDLIREILSLYEIK
jgi:hypothetical protein